jgi:hypothetical protein
VGAYKGQCVTIPMIKIMSNQDGTKIELLTKRRPNRHDSAFQILPHLGRIAFERYSYPDRPQRAPAG